MSLRINYHNLWMDSPEYKQKSLHGADFYLQLETIYQYYLKRYQQDKKQGVSFLLDELKSLISKNFEFVRLKLHTAIFGTLICLGVDLISFKDSRAQFEILGKFYELKFKASWTSGEFFQKIRAAFRYIDRGVEFFNPAIAQKINSDYELSESVA